MARDFTWYWVGKEKLDHAVDRYKMAACGMQVSTYLAPARAASHRCGTCTAELDRRAVHQAEANVVGTRPIGEEYLEYLRAMYHTQGIGGVRETVLDALVIGWLNRHRLAVRLVRKLPGGERVALWSLTPAGRSALDRERY